MQKCKITALVDTVEATKTFGKSNFTKRNLVVVDDPNAQYPNFALFEFVKDDVALLDGIRKGQRVTVTFTPTARYWDPKNGKPAAWFCSCRATAISAEPPPDDDSAPESREDCGGEEALPF